MILKTLRLHNFRNYDDETIVFSPRLNIIYGDNAQGKTNIIEAIFLLSTGRSFRTSHLKELIKEGSDYFLIEAQIIKDLVAQTIKIYFDKNQKKATYNLTPLPSFTNLLGILPSVTHVPSDVDLISGTPALRRRFLNIHLAQQDPLYIHHLSRFSKALKQRNALLKSKSLTAIEFFEKEMAKSASYIVFKRKKTLESLNVPANEIMQILSDKQEKVTLKYMPALSHGEDPKDTYRLYLTQLEKNRKKELLIGSTLFGPHKDEFISYIDNKTAKIYGSEGQKRCLISALKLAEHKLLCDKMNTQSIMNLDDLGIHLDSSRQNKLKLFIQNSLNQVFITMPKLEDIWAEIESEKFYVKNGKVF